MHYGRETVIEEWHQHRDFEWLLTDENNFVIGQIKHYPTGWALSWRPSIKRGVKWQEKQWADTELEEAKAWAIAMIRMHQ